MKYWSRHRNRYRTVCEKLSKLDQKFDERFDKIEKSITNIYQEIENVKTTPKVHSEILDKEETLHHEFADRMPLHQCVPIFD
jgi:carbonic anhydrase